jgi:hypothetical protein
VAKDNSSQRNDSGPDRYEKRGVSEQFDELSRGSNRSIQAEPDNSSGKTIHAQPPSYYMPSQPKRPGSGSDNT